MAINTVTGYEIPSYDGSGDINISPVYIQPYYNANSHFDESDIMEGLYDRDEDV